MQPLNEIPKVAWGRDGQKADGKPVSRESLSYIGCTPGSVCNSGRK